MPAATSSVQSRPNSAPAYYLSRPASLWLAARRRPSASAARRAAVPDATAAPSS
jgi:hypothetical protein